MSSIWAKQFGYVCIVSTLITLLWGANSAVYCASEHQLVQKIQELDERERDLKPQVAQNSTPTSPANSGKIRAALEAAIKEGNREMGNEQLETLLEDEVTKLPPKQRESLLDESLKCAVLVQQNREDTYAMELLLAAKADPNALTASQENQPSYSALHWATSARNPQAVQLFLDHGGDPLVTNDAEVSCLESDSDTVTHLLLVENILQRLKAGKLYPNYSDPHTHQPLLSMALNVSPPFLPHIVPLVKELLARGANPNTPNTKGDLPLHTVLKYRRDQPDLTNVNTPEPKDQEQFYAKLCDLETVLREHGALEDQSQAQQWPCLIQ